jgi:hypothetical protein
VKDFLFIASYSASVALAEPHCQFDIQGGASKHQQASSNYSQLWHALFMPANVGEFLVAEQFPKGSAQVFGLNQRIFYG